MENTIMLGGVWADWNARVEAAEARALAAEESEYAHRSKCEALALEKESLLEDYHALAHSLTATQLQDKNNQQILDIVRSERNNLETRTAGLESQRAWQDVLLTELRERTVLLQDEVAASAAAAAALSRDKQQLQQSLHTASLVLLRTEAAVDALKRTVQARDASIVSLQHSVDAKARQLAVLCRERDRLKAECAVLAKASPRKPLLSSSPLHLGPDAPGREKEREREALPSRVMDARAFLSALHRQPTRATAGSAVSPATPAASPCKSPVTSALNRRGPAVDRLAWLLDAHPNPNPNRLLDAQPAASGDTHAPAVAGKSTYTLTVIPREPSMSPPGTPGQGCYEECSVSASDGHSPDTDGHSPDWTVDACPSPCPSTCPIPCRSPSPSSANDKHCTHPSVDKENMDPIPNPNPNPNLSASAGPRGRTVSVSRSSSLPSTPKKDIGAILRQIVGSPQFKGRTVVSPSV